MAQTATVLSWRRQHHFCQVTLEVTGTPQPSLDMDANRLVLLDRAENGDNGHSEEGDIPF